MKTETKINFLGIIASAALTALACLFFGPLGLLAPLAAIAISTVCKGEKNAKT